MPEISSQRDDMAARLLEMSERVWRLELRVAVLEAEAKAATPRLTLIEQLVQALVMRPINHASQDSSSNTSQQRYLPFPFSQQMQEAPRPATSGGGSSLNLPLLKEFAMVAVIGLLLGIVWTTRDPVGARVLVDKVIERGMK